MSFTVMVLYLLFLYFICLAGEGIAKNKRLKLEYKELLPSNSCASEMWNILLTNESLIDKEDLIDAVKQGMTHILRVLHA